jgi:hypothetical protein
MKMRAKARKALRNGVDLGSIILLDVLMIAAAFGCRAVLLWLADQTVLEPHSWATESLRIITDIGLVGTALIYTFADLVKRTSRLAKEVLDEADESKSNLTRIIEYAGNVDLSDAGGKTRG